MNTSISPDRRSRSFLTGALIAVVIGLLLGVGLATWWPARDPAPRTDDGGALSIADHLIRAARDRRILEPAGIPLEHRTRDRDDAARWLSGRLGFDVELGDTPWGWSLQGVRVWNADDRASAMAHYAGPGGSITVFARPAAGSARADSTRSNDLWQSSEDGLRVAMWVDGDVVWSAASDLPGEELAAWLREHRAR